MSATQAIEQASSSADVLARHGRSFHQAGLLLSPAVRQDAALLYHFCRLVDDTADEAPEAAAARDGLDRLEAELRGQLPPRPLIERWVELARRRSVPLDAACELVRGVRGDLGQVRVTGDAELIRYGYRVAGTVGLMMCGVLGVDEPEALPFAVDLGVGMQLTNICRDVYEDRAMGRVYLPAERLAEAGSSTDELLLGRSDPQVVSRIVRDVLGLAERYYRSADLGMRWIPLRSRVAILAASRIYRSIGRRLIRVHAGDPSHGRTVVPTWERGLHALGGLAQLSRPTLWGLGPAPRHDVSLHQHLRGLPGCEAES